MGLEEHLTIGRRDGSCPPSCGLFCRRASCLEVHANVMYQLGLTEQMSITLGFGGNDMKIITKTTESPYVADLTIVSTIYMYCDIVEPQIVGDTSAQLLKSIPVEGKFGDIIAKTFTNIQYVPIQTRSFEAVEILLRNDTSDPVPFERGKVVITLHFRQHSYFT